MSVTHTPNWLNFVHWFRGRSHNGQTDGGDYNIPFAFLKKRGDNEVWVSSIKYRYFISFLQPYCRMLSPFVPMHSNLLLCWHDFCDACITFYKYTLYVRHRSDFKELAVAVPIGYRSRRASAAKISWNF